MAADLTAEHVAEFLRTRKLGHAYHYVDSTTSTNAALMEMASAGASHGTVLAAGMQTGGRGRLERKWFSPAGGLWFSVLLAPKKISGLIPLAVGVAVAETLADMGLGVKLKWPNDVLLDDGKIAGILCESTLGKVVAGIGVNANITSSELGDLIGGLRAATLMEALGAVDRGELLGKILMAFEELYDGLENGTSSVVVERWKSASSTLGRNVLVNTRWGDVCGRAVELTADGGLVILEEDGRTNTVLSGDCIHLRF